MTLAPSRHFQARSAEAAPAYGWLTEFAASRWLAYRKLLSFRQPSSPLKIPLDKTHPVLLNCFPWNFYTL
jgi:hypothetical protein